MNIDDNVIYIGKKRVWDGKVLFGLETEDRRQHLYVIGKTGTGKTTLLRNLLIQDIAMGRGIALIDPHGDLAEELLNHIPGNRIDDVVYFDPADTEYPIGLNLFTKVDPDSRHLIASGIVSIFKNIWPDYWGPRLEYIMYVCAASLLECENTSLLGVIRLLSDESYRRWVVKQIKDPLLRNFWNKEWEQYGKNFLTEAIMPVQNKVGQMLLVPFMRNILGQIKSKIDMGFMMDNRRIFIANLSKGKLGDDKAHLLGSILVTKFQMAAMERANVPEGEREDFFCYVDEFQNFTTDSFSSLLSEARKYRLNMTLSHQYTSQLKDSIKNAVFGNVGSIISFRVGYEDALALEGEFGKEISWRTFTELPNFHCCSRLTQGGTTRSPSLGEVLPPMELNFGKKEIIKQRSREKYALPKNIVEDKIWRWMMNQ
jgi:hypothetical protein